MTLTTELLGLKNSFAEKMEERAKKAAAKGKVKYPNPAFWRCKDNMDFKVQMHCDLFSILSFKIHVVTLILEINL